MAEQRPQETLRQLCEIFPPFSVAWEDEHAPPEDGLVDGVYYVWTHHNVMRAFLDYVARQGESCDERQLRRIGAWVNNAVLNDDELENAVVTCFLKRARRNGVHRNLWRHLSEKAKAKSDA